MHRYPVAAVSPLSRWLATGTPIAAAAMAAYLSTARNERLKDRSIREKQNKTVKLTKTVVNFTGRVFLFCPPVP